MEGIIFTHVVIDGTKDGVNDSTGMISASLNENIAVMATMLIGAQIVIAVLMYLLKKHLHP
jgi:hypothetical protein